MTTEFRTSSTRSRADLIQEWEDLAEERHRQIASGEDISFHKIIAPTALRLLSRANLTSILDIGSGTGEFTLQLARISEKVVAVEPSNASIAVARTICQSVGNIRYINAALERSADSLAGEEVTAAVAVMTLMTAPDLRGFANTLAALLPEGSCFVAVLTHPCFWPRYWGYDREHWFRYQREVFIEAPFVISRRRTNFRTTHIHRPLEEYVNVFSEAGFRLDRLEEPMPTADVQSLYPASWEFPRFLGLRWQRCGLGAEGVAHTIVGGDIRAAADRPRIEQINPSDRR